MHKDEDGYRLWLRYRKINDAERLSQYRRAIEYVALIEEGPAYDVIKSELDLALPAMLDRKITVEHTGIPGNGIMIGTTENLNILLISIPRSDSMKMGEEGFLIRHIDIDKNDKIIITANSEKGLITGVFQFLRYLQTYRDIAGLDVLSSPRIRRRILCHWDNLDGSIERGYAGQSLWKWDELPVKTDPRYCDYARACASIGINGVVLNNVNSQAEILTSDYLVKTAALAEVLRPYGIRIYLSVPFNAPVQSGDLPTGDPRKPEVIRWWEEKVREIYALIPDFGGFQVKAGSEGQPGPQDYGAGHHHGANMLADILRSYGGIVLWRAFVYDIGIDTDRAKCAYKEFKPLNGKFNTGVFVQVKNGPVDFQPREPFHPLFGAMPETPLALELQITQEYLGQAVHLVYLAPMWKEILDADTFAAGGGSTVSGVVDGSLFGHRDSAVTGVANTGSDRNWCGHHFAQANWYAWGRLAWDYSLSSEEICEEWIRMIWSNDSGVVDSVKKLMLGSWEACVDYMTPLGLHHIMREGHHYGPDPAFAGAGREDWNSVYYHKADNEGLGFNRSSTGSNATGQYFSPLCEVYDNPDTCPDEYLLWFHHIPWDKRLQSGRTLIDEIRYRYETGVEYAAGMLSTWQKLKGKVDGQRYEHVLEKLVLQYENAELWRDVCVDYFQRFTGRGTD